MGLSSSQARLLNLTTRMHQIEYKAAKLEAMKLQMANESTRVYEDYLDALEKSKIQVKTLTTDGAVTYQDITSYGQFLSAGYAFVYNNTVFSSATDLGTILNSIAGVTSTGSAGGGVTILNTAAAITNLINSGYVTIVATNGIDSTGNPTFPGVDSIEFANFETSVSTNTGLQEVTDSVELKKAEAKYEADMKRIDMKDRRYDQDLSALDNERNAVKQEMDTLKTVAKDNVERTFKLFG